MKTCTFVATLVCGSFLATTSAIAATVDFDNYPGGTTAVTQLLDSVTGTSIGSIAVGPPTTGSGINSGEAWLFDTALISAGGDAASSGGDDGDLGAPFTNAAGDTLNPGHVLIIQENKNSNGDPRDNPDDDANGGVITFDFSNLVYLESINIFDMTPGTMFDFFENDSDAAPIFSLTTTVSTDTSGPPNEFATILFGYSGPVDKLVIDMSQKSGALDDLQYTVVPIPAAAWLFASALGIFGYLAKRKANA